MTITWANEFRFKIFLLILRVVFKFGRQIHIGWGVRPRLCGRKFRFPFSACICRTRVLSPAEAPPLRPPPPLHRPPPPVRVAGVVFVRAPLLSGESRLLSVWSIGGGWRRGRARARRSSEVRLRARAASLHCPSPGALGAASSPLKALLPHLLGGTRPRRAHGKGRSGERR